MDGIILAGGIGTRMLPLTANTPKPLLHLQGQPILAWSLLSLRGIIDRVLVVVHYLKAQIERFMARQHIFPDYQLVEQLPQPLGTGHALECCRPHLRGDHFLVVNGDDLFSRAALAQLAQHDFGILSMRRGDFDRYGVIVTDEAGHLRAIDEKPPRDRYSAPAPCNIGAYKLTRAIFDYPLRKSSRGEYEIVDAVSLAARDHAIKLIDCPFWLPIGDPPALEAAQSVDLERWLLPHAKKPDCR